MRWVRQCEGQGAQLSDTFPRVFVSSVMHDFADERKAARHGIGAVGASPVLIEDYPSLASSSRNACLDAIESCDAVVILLGARPGWKTPSGKYVIEEEFEHARKKGLPVFAFLQSVPREADSDEIAKRISDYLSGFYRKTFATSADLETLVAAAVQNVVTRKGSRSITSTEILKQLMKKSIITRETGLRLVLGNGRGEDFVELPALAKESTQDAVIDAAVAAGIFSRRRGKVPKMLGPILAVLEHDTETYQGEVSAAIEIIPTGILCVEIRVTGVRGDRRSMEISRVMEILEADVLQQAGSCITFAKKFLDQNDPYHRYENFEYGWGLTSVGNKNLVVSPTPSGRGITMSMNRPDVVLAFATPEPLSRAALDHPVELANRALDHLRFQMQQKSGFPF